MTDFNRNPNDDIEKVLYSAAQIRECVVELGARISVDYKGKDLVLVGILRGALVFLSDLSRAIEIPHSFDMVGASSYGSATASSGRVQITKDVEVNLRGKHVVVIEDIYDSGRTLAAIRDLLYVHRPASIELCALLYKRKSERARELPIRYSGFEIPDKFVVGYGLDYSEMYRHLPYIGVLKRQVYEKD